ncbi:uncharacterized protein LOC117175611 [Belonocnema kinseyi]|uniref:uncharacterized protein LOC117175611 n=1 Tax=Belonocnema kinseyi TaxID=2817044 RepID=UPI00143DACE1|nr:uncharacterized protein LOC117175611 [Belonocnema kinseyi]
MNNPADQNFPVSKHSSSGSNEGEPAKKIPKSSKSFQMTWFDEFSSRREWVVPLADETKFQCKICKNRCYVENRKFKNSSNVTANSFDVDSLAASSFNTDFSESESPQFGTFKQKVPEAEIRITAFFMEHNLPFRISSDLIRLFQDMEPSVLKNVKLGHIKMVLVANNVVCAAGTDRISNILRKQSFAVYEDETSDRTLEKWLSLMVRYVEPMTLSVRVE